MSWDFQYALEWMPFSSQQLLLSTVNHCILGMKHFFWMVPYPKRKTRWLPTFLHQIGMSTNSCTFSEDMPVAGQFACPPPIRWLQSIMQLLSTTWAEEHKANPWNHRCAMENCKLIKTQSNSMDIYRFFWKSGALSVSCDIRPRSACTEYLQTQRWASPPLTKLVPAAAQNLVEGVRILDQVYYTKGDKEDNYIINQMLNPNLRTSCMSQRLNWNPSNGSSRWILVVVACRSSH